MTEGYMTLSNDGVSGSWEVQCGCGTCEGTEGLRFDSEEEAETWLAETGLEEVPEAVV